jgi:hypothetical protein
MPVNDLVLAWHLELLLIRAVYRLGYMRFGLISFLFLVVFLE